MAADQGQRAVFFLSPISEGIRLHETYTWCYCFGLTDVWEAWPHSLGSPSWTSSTWNLLSHTNTKCKIYWKKKKKKERKKESYRENASSRISLCEVTGQRSLTCKYASSIWLCEDTGQRSLTVRMPAEKSHRAKFQAVKCSFFFLFTGNIEFFSEQVGSAHRRWKTWAHLVSPTRRAFCSKVQSLTARLIYNDILKLIFLKTFSDQTETAEMMMILSTCLSVVTVVSVCCEMVIVNDNFLAGQTLCVRCCSMLTGTFISQLKTKTKQQQNKQASKQTNKQ